MQIIWGGRQSFYLKPAACVISARRTGTTATYNQLNKYFGLMQMPIVSSQYWNMVHGATPEQVKQDIEGLQIMRTLADKPIKAQLKVVAEMVWSLFI